MKQKFFQMPAGAFDYEQKSNDWINSPAFDIPTYQSSLTIGNTLTYKFIRPVPSRWHQFWYRVLLGWIWVDLTKKESK